jgi:DinB superfamily
MAMGAPDASLLRPPEDRQFFVALSPGFAPFDVEARPSLEEVLKLRRERMDEVGRTIGAVTAAELERVCAPPDSPGHPTRDHTVLACLHVILNEEWEHNCYANRDLDILDTR